jgi:hypothetical protein
LIIMGNCKCKNVTSNPAASGLRHLYRNHSRAVFARKAIMEFVDCGLFEK